MGEIAIVGLGPGPAAWLTPEADDRSRGRRPTSWATSPMWRAYRSGRASTRHASDNRVERDRARHAFTLALEGRRVAVVSGGDPGIFAMAAAIFETLDAEPALRTVPVRVVPGLSAMQAAAARLGAPLGHDFCVLSLSDNLKPWPVVLRRLSAAVDGDFVIAIYNPMSKARPAQLGDAFDHLRARKHIATPVAFARAIGRPDERLHLTTLGEADPALADMATLVIVGSSETRLVEGQGGRRWMLTPRSYGGVTAAQSLGSEGLPAMSLDPAQHRVEREKVEAIARDHRPIDRDHRHAEVPRRVELGRGTLPTAVLGDQRIDPLPPHQGVFIGVPKRPAIENEPVIRRQFGRVRRVDGADDVMVLGRPQKGREAEASDRQQHAAGHGAESVGRSVEIRHRAPALAVYGAPRGSREGDQWHVATAASRNRMSRDAGRERVGRVHNGLDGLMVEIGREPIDTTEPTDPRRDVGQGGAGGPARQRQGGRDIGATREGGAERGGFRGTAEDQEAHRLAKVAW